ncbi:MAG: Flp family type IVb pilin [Rhodomicrobium sp.]|nr:Flp family type IVb pilin [Rhodomicrobium sp.]
MTNSFSALVKRFAREERGASMVEYGVLVAIISAGLIALVLGVGDQLEAAFLRVQTQLGLANAG